MKVHLELTEKELRELVFEYFRRVLGEVPLDKKNIKIQVRSKQNYKSEWEEAAFRAIVDK